MPAPTDRQLFEIGFGGQTYYLTADDELAARAQFRARLKLIDPIGFHLWQHAPIRVTPVNRVRLPQRPDPIA